MLKELNKDVIKRVKGIMHSIFRTYKKILMKNLPESQKVQH